MSEALNYLKKEIKERNGKVFLGFVHPTLYGPLRNLNFVLETSDPISLDKYIINPTKDIVSDIWKETMLATQLMVLPWEMIKDCEIKPQTFSSIKDSESYIRKKLKDNKPKDTDLFYYRLGKI
jgi:hypothetical protein